MFHLLRRQMKRNYRKPLVVMSPKGLLRSPLAASPLSDMAGSIRFRPVLDSETNEPSARRVILCSGKHYYTLSERLTAAPDPDIALVRVEELSPFPYRQLAGVLGKYTNAHLVWAQEEPRNQGAWSYVRPRIEEVLGGMGRQARVRYAGRKEGATVAVAVGEWHKREVEEIVRDALGDSAR